MRVTDGGNGSSSQKLFRCRRRRRKNKASSKAGQLTYRADWKRVDRSILIRDAGIIFVYNPLFPISIFMQQRCV